MSKTPLTDAATETYQPPQSEADEFYGRWPEEEEIVDASFARDLEEKLAAALKEIEKLRQEIETLRDQRSEYDRLLDIS